MVQWTTLAFVIKERTDLINNNTQISKVFMDNIELQMRHGIMNVKNESTQTMNVLQVDVIMPLFCCRI